MPQSRNIEIQFPLAGVNRSAAYQRQAPYTCPDAQNVVPWGAIDRRLTGGSRPGLVFCEHNIENRATAYGGDDPVQALGFLSRYGTDPMTLTGLDISTGKYRAAYFQHFEDRFSGNAIGAAWRSMSSTNLPTGFTTPTMPVAADFVDGLLQAGQSENLGAIANTNAVELRHAAGHSISMWIVPYRGAFKGKYSLWVEIDSSNSPPQQFTDGTQFELDLTVAGFYTLKRHVNSAGPPVTHATTVLANGVAIPNGISPYEFKVEIRRDYDIEGTYYVMFGSTCIWDGTGTPPKYSANHSRVGFQVQGTASSYPAQARYVAIDCYGTTDYVKPVPQMFHVADGYFHVATMDRRLTGIPITIDSTLVMPTARPLSVAMLDNRVFVGCGSSQTIAECSRAHVGGADHQNIVHPAADPGQWTNLADIKPGRHVLEITAPDALVGTYMIEGVGASYVALRYNLGVHDAEDITARVVPGIMVYDPISLNSAGGYFKALGAYNIGQTPFQCIGIPPSGAHVLCAWNGRLVAANTIQSPNRWYMSRSGDALDWDFNTPTEDDWERPMTGPVKVAGQGVEGVTALIPFSKDYLLIACATQMIRMLGDPAANGAIETVSPTIGIVGMQAWTILPTGEAMFLGADGLYTLSPASGVNPVPFSSASLPAEFRDCAAYGDYAIMGYEPRFNAVMIFLASTNMTERKSWWLDLTTGSFWPLTLQATHWPRSVGNDPEGRLILGCLDGKMRRFDAHAEIDEGGNAIASFVKIGPLRAGDAGEEAIVAELSGIVAQRSGSVAYSVLAAKTPEECIDATAQAGATGTWTPGVSYTGRPRVRGAAFCVKLANGASDRNWAVESVRARVESAGVLHP